MNTTSGRPRSAFIPCTLIVVSAVLVYVNSFSVPFVYDDLNHIVGNPHIRSLWPPWRVVRPPPGASCRPVVALSLALNYAIHRLDVRGYHVTNLAIHILAAWVLFGLVRRTLRTDTLRERFGGVSTPIASAVALVWTVHPLQTESVTYLIQRGESLMGLFYLLVLYCVVRGALSQRARGWYVAGVVACALGMGTKEVMVTAPVLALLYDRVFLAGSFREAFRRRWGFYAGLAATWLILAALILSVPRSTTAGPQLEQSGPLSYALTQCQVLVTCYLKLSVWPHPLVFDYGWPVVHRFGEAAVWVIVVGVLLLGTVLLYRRRAPWGYLGAWFFILLAPSSSFLPIADAAVEHRMYLALAAVVALAVVGSCVVGRRLLRFAGPRAPEAGWILGTTLTAVLVLTLGFLSFQRNRDYRSVLSIWSDCLRERPENPRAHLNVGFALAAQGRYDEAIARYREVLRLSPGHLDEGHRLLWVKASNNLGLALADQGKLEEAITHFTGMLESNPKDDDAHNNLGAVLARAGKSPEARAQFEEALRIAPHNADAHYNLASLLAERGDAADAIGHYREALRLGMASPYLFDGLAWILATHRDPRYRDGAEAVRLAEQACELTAYRGPQMLGTLAAAYAETGRFDEAVSTAEKGIRLAHQQGRAKVAAAIQEGLAHYRAGRPWHVTGSAP